MRFMSYREPGIVPQDNPLSDIELWEKRRERVKQDLQKEYDEHKKKWDEYIKIQQNNNLKSMEFKKQQSHYEKWLEIFLPLVKLGHPPNEADKMAKEAADLIINKKPILPNLMSCMAVRKPYTVEDRLSMWENANPKPEMK